MSVWSDQAAGFLEICESSSSEVWKHFLKNRHTEKARCKTCKTTLSCKDGTTTTLITLIILQMNSKILMIINMMKLKSVGFLQFKKK